MLRYLDGCPNGVWRSRRRRRCRSHGRHQGRVDKRHPIGVHATATARVREVASIYVEASGARLREDVIPSVLEQDRRGSRRPVPAAARGLDNRASSRSGRRSSESPRRVVKLRVGCGQRATCDVCQYCEPRHSTAGKGRATTWPLSGDGAMHNRPGTSGSWRRGIRSYVSTTA